MDADGQIDGEIWGRLVEIVRAAHDLDREHFTGLARAFAAEMELRQHQRLGLYVGYLLRNALGKIVGGRVPTDSELRAISKKYISRFRIVIPTDRPILEDLFRKAFERAPRAKKLKPGDLMHLGLAALGVLYEDPDEDLNRMNPHLNNWWLKYSDEFIQEGLLE